MLARSLELDPADEEQWVALISLNMQANDPEKVETNALRAMHYFPSNGQFPLMLSAAYQQEQRYADALKMLNQSEALTDSTDMATLSAITGQRGI